MLHCQTLFFQAVPESGFFSWQAKDIKWAAAWWIKGPGKWRLVVSGSGWATKMAVSFNASLPFANAVLLPLLLSTDRRWSKSQG